MRYNGNCEIFCTGKLTGDLLDDPVVIAGQRKAEIAENIENMRRERWGFCTIVIENNNPKILITNRIALEISCENEQKEMQELARLITVFNQLNPLFEEIQTKYKFLRSPTLTGVRQLRKESVNTINTLVSRIKSEVQYRTGIQSRGKSLDDVLRDPAFMSIKKENDERIKQEEANLKQIDFYIATIKNILKEGV